MKMSASVSRESLPMRKPCGCDEWTACEPHYLAGEQRDNARQYFGCGWWIAGLVSLVRAEEWTAEGEGS